MALFSLNIPDGLPISPIIGKLPGSGLSGFTQYYIPFGAADGSLTQDSNITWNGSTLNLQNRSCTAGNFKSNVYYNSTGSKSLAYVSASNYWTIDANFYVWGNTDLTGTVSIASMSTAGIVKNNASGILSGGNTITVSEISDIASHYLKLDCSNDPLTGTLQTADEVDINGTTEYLKQEEW